MPATDLGSLSDLEGLGAGFVVLNFWADWAAPCQQLNAIFDQLADQYPLIKFVKVEAEKLEDVTEKFQVTAVPSFLFVKGGKVIDRIEGAKAPELADKVQKYNQQAQKGDVPAAPSGGSKEALEDRLKKLVNFAPVMLFMKGVPSAPECGFSRKTVDLLNEEGITFSSFNILSDQEVREGLKGYSNWPTYPQLYIEGKLIGGLDILKEMREGGELKSSVPAVALKQSLNSKLEALINKSPVMLFMKGVPGSPQCGFSSKIVELLQKNNVTFNTFNILSDEEVRQGLKTYSNWPTFPQLYSKGKLIGGLDIVKQLDEDGDLLDTLS